MNKKMISNIAIAMTTLCFFAFGVNAQVQIGAKLGLNATSLNSSNFNIKDFDLSGVGTDIDELADTEFKLGLHAGAFAIVDIGPLNIMPEVLWSLKGAKNFTPNSQIAMHYVSVPVLFGFNIKDIFTLQVGPQAGFLIDAILKTENKDTRSIKDNYGFENMDFAGVIELMFQWPNIGHISARYMHGLTPAQKLSNQSGKEFKYSNQTFQVGIGIPIVKVGF